MIRTLTASMVAASLAFAGAASARDHGGRYDDGRYAWADVVRVEPIISSIERPVADRQCYEQPVVYREPVRYHSGRRDRAPAILGAIVGGVIGSQFGSGGGRDAATAAGALLGYQSVRDDQRRYGGAYVSGGHEYTRYETRCTTQSNYVRDDTVTGYEVTYRFRGQTYQTVTDYNPGDRIQVEVDVRPVR
ncbi:MAG: glycine zipper 2TM domain-containing protein [Pseudomarimonas sp.]